MSKPNLITHLLIDAYNVIHSIPEMKKLLNAHLPSVIDAFGKYVIPVHDANHLRTTLVFDGNGREIEIQRPFKDDLNFSYLFSPAGVTADSIIEQLVLSSKKNQPFIVVSRDIPLLHTVTSVGAQTMSPGEFIDWVERSKSSISRKINAIKKDSDSKWKKHPKTKRKK